MSTPTDWLPNHLIEKLTQKVPSSARLEAICIGLFWTIAKSQPRAALSATALGWDQSPHGQALSTPGQYVGRSIHELVDRARFLSHTERSIALAALHSALPQVLDHGVALNGITLLKSLAALGPIALIGHFPFAQSFKAQGLDITSYELPHRLRQGDRSIERLPQEASKYAVLAMTSATLITGTLQEIVGWMDDHVITMVIGPSVPLDPLIFDYGIDIIAGTRVLDFEAARLSIAQGATHHQLHGLEKLTFITPQKKPRSQAIFKAMDAMNL